MDYELVFIRFCELTGLSGDAAERYHFLCFEAAYYFESIVTDEELLTTMPEAFCSAAAALAAYNCSLIRAANPEDDISDFKAGDLSVSFTKTQGRAEMKEYLDMCMKSIAPFLRDDNFAFEATPL